MLVASFAVAALAAASSVLASEQGKTDYLLSSRYSSMGRPVKRGFQEGDGSSYNLTFVHVNDLHGHLDTFRHSGVDCPADNLAKNISCFGGYARLLSKIEEVKSSVDDCIVANVGDEWQGTLFYRFYEPKGSKIAEVINQVPFDAFTLGNHEFDQGDEPLAAFLANLTFPTISTNIKTNTTSLAAQLIPFLEFPQHELAIVAVTTTEVPDIAKPDVGTTFEPYVESIQPVVDGLLDGSIGNGTTKRVIALTHIGYEEDIKLAKTLRNVHLIIGGHSHTPLGGDPQYSQGPYPTVEKDLDGEDVFIVTAYRWGEYLGRIDVAFEAEGGRILAYTGAPIIMTQNMTQDEELQSFIEEARVPFEAYSSVQIGETLTTLEQSTCYDGECTLGSAITDSMVWYRHSAGGSFVAGAIHNAGGIRATIEGPNVTQGDVLTSFPFGNQLVDLTFDGQRFWDIIEGVVSGVNLEGKPTSEIQVSKEIHYTWNPNATVGSRLISLTLNGTAVVPDQNYTIVTLDFLATGGDSIFPYSPKAAPPALAAQDEVFAAFVKEFSPLNYTIEGRIVQTNETVQQLPGGNVSTAAGTGGSNGTQSTTDGTSGGAIAVPGSVSGLGAVLVGALFAGLFL